MNRTDDKHVMKSPGNTACDMIFVPEPPENKNAETMAQMYLPVDGTGRIVTDPASPAEVKSSDGGHGVGFNTTGSSADTTKGAVPNTTYPVCAGRDYGVDSITLVLLLAFIWLLIKACPNGVTSYL